MSNTTIDVMIYTTNTLSTNQFEQLSKSVYDKEGVISLSRNIKTPQCLMLIYNASKIKARNILNTITNMGVKASLVGI